MVEAAPGLGVETLTVYAFSSDNWRRPAAKVSALMRLLRRYMRQETSRCVKNGVRVRFIGRRDRLDPAVLREVERCERATEHCGRLTFRIALDYSARDAILEAATRVGATREEFAAALGPEVDLLIRTGGEQRLSDFLLWECAYAEFFTPTMWPDFGQQDLESAIRNFRSRDRRYGAVA